MIKGKSRSHRLALANDRPIPFDLDHIVHPGIHRAGKGSPLIVVLSPLLHPHLASNANSGSRLLPSARNSDHLSYVDQIWIGYPVISRKGLVGGAIPSRNAGQGVPLTTV